jgi:hypothetical protein
MLVPVNISGHNLCAVDVKTWRRESLGRKVESDGDLKGDYASLKNSWDSVEKDFATWSGPVKPIDWAKYGKQIEVAGFVDFMKVGS